MFADWVNVLAVRLSVLIQVLQPVQPTAMRRLKAVMAWMMTVIVLLMRTIYIMKLALTSALASSVVWVSVKEVRWFARILQMQPAQQSVMRLQSCVMERIMIATVFFLKMKLMLMKTVTCPA